MPKKSAKKRKEKNEDFQKTKLKVGKKKAVADNYTDTSFKSQAIVLPNQGITQDKTGQLVNRKNHTLSELSAQLRHYSANVRKDALTGMKDLLQRHPQTLTPSLGALLNAIVRLLIDDDEAVRRTLHALLTFMLPQLSLDSLTPFLPLLITYTTSAMAHIREDIRSDAVKFMALWIDVAPSAVVVHAERILPNYLSLLGASTTTQKSGVDANKGVTGEKMASGFSDTGSGQGQLMSYKSRVQILTGLHSFLEAWTNTNVTRDGSDNEISQSDYWFFHPFLSSPSTVPPAIQTPSIHADTTPITSIPCDDQPVPNHRQTSSLLHPSYNHLHVFSASNNSTLSTTSSSVSSTSSAGSEGNNADPRTLLSNLYPILLSTWLDAAPAAFIESGSAASDALKACAIVIKLLGLVWRSWIVTGRFRGSQGGVDKSEGKKADERKWLEGHLKGVLRHFMGYFPFGKDCRGLDDGKTEFLLQAMNATFCELVALFLLASDQSASSEKKRSLLPWADHVIEYVLDTLGWQQNSAGGKKSQLVQDVKPDHLTAFLPAVWCLLNALGEKREDVFEAVFDHYNSCHAQSSSKKILMDFMAKTFTVQHHRQYTGPLSPKGSSTTPLSKTFHAWALSLPRTVWEMRQHCPSTTLLALRSLGEICRVYGDNRGDANETSRAFLKTVQASIVPYFHITLTRPNGESANVYGPFLNAGQRVQVAAIDLVAATALHNTESNRVLGDKIRVALEACAGDTSLLSETRQYIQEMFYIMTAKASASTCTIETI